MREVTERLAQMLDGSRAVTFEANVVRGDQSRDGLPVILGGSLSWDEGQQVEFSGALRIPLADSAGRSVAPRSSGDLFAPFGSEVMLSAVVSVGEMEERVQLARARIVKVPSAQTETVWFGGQWVTFGEVIAVELRDRMEQLRADEFDAAVAVTYPASAWRELEQLSPFPVVRVGGDATLPASLSYEGTRADAVERVAQALGGVPVFDSEGNLTVRRRTSTPVLTLTLGPNGSVANVGSVMDSDGVYNRVVVKGKRTDGTRFQVELTADGDLSPTIWGRRTYTADQGDFITTVEQADDYAARLLAQVSSIRTADLEVQCLLDPRLELGDVVRVEGGGESSTIRVSKIAYGDAMMTVTGRLL